MNSTFRSASGEWRPGWRVIICLALIVAVMLVVNIGWRVLHLPKKTIEGVTQPWPHMIFSTLLATGSLAVVVLLLRKLEARGLEAIGMPLHRGALFQTSLGTLIGAAPIGLLVLVAVLAGYGHVEPGRFPVSDIVAVMLPLLIANLVIAGWEEWVLRGYIFRQLSLGISPAVAAVGTAIAFGLLHSGNPGANWQGLLYTMVGGLFMAWILIRTGSLWLLIGYHFGWNATSFLLFGLDLSGHDRGASLLSTRLSGPDWITGGSYGFEAALPTALSEVLVLSIVLYWIGRRAHRFPVGDSG